MSAELQQTPGVYPCACCPLTFSYPEDLSEHYLDIHW